MAYSILGKALSSQDYPWQTLYKSILLLHTLVVYGSEKAVNCAINLCHMLPRLQEYNSALVNKTIFAAGGTDYGAKVRDAAKKLNPILQSDDEIWRVRQEAQEGSDTLVPMGNDMLPSTQPPVLAASSMVFGQGLEKSVGAGFDLSAVPGMYDGRPDRYFDDHDRKMATTGDHQFTREVCT
jgi:hypothetical protein